MGGRLPARRHAFALAVIALGATLLAWPVLEGIPPGTFLGLKARDGLFLARHLLGKNPPVSDRIVVVAIDPLTVTAPDLQRPMALWSEENARVVEAVARGGAVVVVLDVVLPYPGQTEEADRELALALRAAPTVLAVDLDDASGALATSNPRIFYAVGDPPEVAGFARTARDGDGVLRRASFVHEYRPPGGSSLQAPSPRGHRPAEVGLPKVLTLWFQGSRRLLGLSLEDFVRAWEGRTGGGLPLSGREVPLVAGASGEAPQYMLINYAGPDGTMPRVSYLEVLRRRDDEAWLRETFGGRLVFLGVTVPDFQDYHLTPMAWAQGLSAASVDAPGGGLGGVLAGRRTQEAQTEMAGVEILAQEANTLVTGAFLRLPGAAAAWAWVAGVCLLGALAGFAGGFRLALLALVLLATASAAVFAFVSRGLVLPLAWPLGGSILAFAGGMGWRHATTDAERRRIRGLLGRYVSDRVASLVVDHPEEAALGGRAAEVTLLFSDLNHFTTWSEKTDPAVVIATMNEYFTAMEEVIFRHGGTLKQFVGDEIMVIFGAPFPQPDAEERAVLTALAMQQELNRLGEAWTPRGIPRLQAKIGIHRGRVVVGNVGSPRRTEYAAVGDAVNLASRVMGLTKSLGHMVLITEAVYRRVEPLVEVREFPPQAVKGREEPVRVYGLDGLRASSASPPAG